jgi:peptidoglycan biosynthesis protein MviN/MurJ (putative lipid II flippase)
VSSLAFLWTLLFGPLYFAYKGVWRHALISAVAALVTMGFSWLIYPFFAHGAVSNHYWRLGWKEKRQWEAEGQSN